MKDPNPVINSKIQDPAQKQINNAFRIFAHKSSEVMGSPGLFMLAIIVVSTWALTGPLFDFSDTWQLVINTGTTIITFLMVFVIQNTQNRDAHTMQLKLDELLRAIKGARNDLINLENCSDEHLAHFEAEFIRLRQSRERNKQPEQING